MSCPNCHCRACQQERLKWQQQPPGYAPLPTYQPPGSLMRCSYCGLYYIGQHTCVTWGPKAP